MVGIGRLVAKQVAVGAGVAQAGVALAAALPHRERDRAIGVRRLESRDDPDEQVVGVVRILAALQHEGAEAQLVAHIGAREDLLLRQPVALARPVGRAQTAVVAVVLAEARELDEAAHEDVVAVDGLAGRAGVLGEHLAQLVIGEVRGQVFVFRQREGMVLGELGDKL